MNRKYILPFGYTLNKLFTSNWSEKNYDGINFYDVFDRLLSMEEKLMNLRKERLMKSQKNHLKRYFKKYFNISAEILQTGTDFTQKYRHIGIEPEESYMILLPHHIFHIRKLFPT